MAASRSRKRKTGRNDPCPCGSGSKYKRCCESKERAAKSIELKDGRVLRQLTTAEEETPKIQAARRIAESKSAALKDQLSTEYGVHINFVPPVEWRGKKVWAIGSRIYPDAPPAQTFHEFLFQLLLEALGEEWRSAPASETSQEHFLRRCFTEYAAWTKQISAAVDPIKDGVWSATPNGWAQYLRSVAWDLALVTQGQRGALPEELIERLRDPTAFQGARYELAVASLFARLNFDIRFLDDEGDLRKEKHVEFIAKHRESGHEVAVEAKSRHRAGVINHPGLHDKDDPLRGDSSGIRRIVKRALEKPAEGKPFFVFIDVNAPAEPATQNFEKAWQQEIIKTLSKKLPSTKDAPASVNRVYVTNFSPQYDGENLALSGEWIAFIPDHVQIAEAGDLGPLLDDALNKYDLVPELGSNGELL